MATILFELISPERMLFSGDVTAMPPLWVEGNMTVLPGPEATGAALDPGILVVTDAQGHGHRAFIRGGFAGENA